ncbi:CDGSH iron-sulfur domain-containing protein [Streptomyces sp. NPDC085524]|uniref:CDGSH iron-sulfur domain-containing protein n=1 Tax=unclassified Streptomyces TaxID=2593676 RepID=UPI0036CA1E8B
MLLEGPVEVVLDDGTTVVSDRFVVALCTCRRTRTPPWCDTGHRHPAPPRHGAGCLLRCRPRSTRGAPPVVPTAAARAAGTSGAERGGGRVSQTLQEVGLRWREGWRVAARPSWAGPPGFGPCPAERGRMEPVRTARTAPVVPSAVRGAAVTRPAAGLPPPPWCAARPPPAGRTVAVAGPTGEEVVVTRAGSRASRQHPRRETR